MNARLRLCLAALIGATSTQSTNLHSQVIVQDDKGRTALLGSGGFFGINTADGSGELAYSNLTNDNPLFMGFSAKAKSTEGISALFGSGALRPGGAVTAMFGFKPMNAGDLTITGRWSRAVSESGLIDSTTRPLPTFARRNLYTWDAGIQIVSMKPRNGALGIALGRRRVNNNDDLAKTSMQTVALSVDAVTRSTVELRGVKDGRVGAIVEEFINYVDADYIWAPERFPSGSVRGFVRTLPGRSNLSLQRNSIGFDIGFHKRGGNVINDRLAAFVVQLNEARAGDKETDAGHRVTFSIVANILPMLDALSDAVPKRSP